MTGLSSHQNNLGFSPSLFGNNKNLGCEFSMGACVNVVDFARVKIFQSCETLEGDIVIQKEPILFLREWVLLRPPFLAMSIQWRVGKFKCS